MLINSFILEYTESVMNTYLSKKNPANIGQSLLLHEFNPICFTNIIDSGMQIPTKKIAIGWTSSSISRCGMERERVVLGRGGRPASHL